MKEKTQINDDTLYADRYKKLSIISEASQAIVFTVEDHKENKKMLGVFFLLKYEINDKLYF